MGDPRSTRAARVGGKGGGGGATGSRDLDSIVLDLEDDDENDGAGGGGAGVGVGRYRAGSGRWAARPKPSGRSTRTTATTATTTTRRGIGEKDIQGLKLDPGEAIEVVGWVEKSVSDIKDTKDTKETKDTTEQGGSEWTIRAIHLFNVGAYVPVPSVPQALPQGSKDETSQEWERRDGLELWD